MNWKQIAATLVPASALILGTFMPTEALAADIKQDEIGKDGKIVKRTQVGGDFDGGFTQLVHFDFIDDPKYDKDALVVRTKGNIASQLEYGKYRKSFLFYSQIRYPGEFGVRVDVKNNPKTEILDYLPKNNIESVNVTETFGYNIGGSISSNQSGNINGGQNYSKTINYKQTNYRTLLNGNTSNQGVGWNVVANSLFYNGHMNARGDMNLFHNDGEERDEKRPSTFFAGKSTLPSLVRSGFNPDFLTYLSNDKENEKTQITVTYSRKNDEIDAAYYNDNFDKYPQMNLYHQNISGNTYKVTYEIDWKKKKVKMINQESEQIGQAPLEKDGE
ncbi:leukocidin family pore-forming toxin [Staphylococcus sp. EZ-P03]|uniref:leukocidin family pore-forming toxin n=1 Tax=Staphylococcus sp. EZ-P03 TaxID=2282739 RepID=UPI000DF77C36|nr:leukocidin family pore-forming toxin [Staphylococcus sp. EZ-P03]